MLEEKTKIGYLFNLTLIIPAKQSKTENGVIALAKVVEGFGGPMWNGCNIEKQTRNAKCLDQVDLRLDTEKLAICHSASLSLCNS